MADIKTTIAPTDIEWEMDWSGKGKDGQRLHPDKPDRETIFERKGALALMLLNGVLHMNNHWWEEDWPKEARETLFLGADCSDVFAWGCSDSEGVGYTDIEPLHRAWRKDPVWGPSVWSMIKRREMPQGPVEKRIREAGIWDLDALRAEHGLRPNHYDGVSMVLAQHKYERYSAWERESGREPKPFDAGWWDGWREFAAANPGWNDEAWKAEDDLLCAEWRRENGHATELDDLGPIEGDAWEETLGAIAEGREPDLEPGRRIELPEDVVGVCLRGLSSSDSKVRGTAARALATASPRTAAKHIRKAMEGETNRLILAEYKAALDRTDG